MTSTITGTIIDGSGTPVVGVAVYARLRPGPATRLSDGSSIADPPATATDVNGNYSFALERQANITPAASWWEIEEDTADLSGGRHTWAVSVGPTNATVQQSLVTPLALLGPTALTVEQGDARYLAQGSLWQVVTNARYGAKGDNINDDTAAINAAIAVANTAGGVVYFPPGIYQITAPLIPLHSGVYLRGATSQVGFFFGEGRTSSIIKPKFSNGDCITVNPSGAKGVGIVDLSFDTAITNGWCMRISSCSGFHVENVAIRQVGVQAQNGIWLQGDSTAPGGGGIYQSFLKHVSLATGGGYVGGSAVRLGDSADNNFIYAANATLMLQVQGYTTGIDQRNGGGNTFTATWVQNCDTLIRDNGAANNWDGGWLEAANVVGFLFDHGATSCIAKGFRLAGNFADLTNNGVRCWFHGNGDWLSIGFTGTVDEPTSTSPTGVYPGIMGGDARLVLAKNGQTPMELANSVGALDFRAVGAGIVAQLTNAGVLGLGAGLLLNRTLTTSVNVNAGNGVPADGSGSSGDFYLRKDGGGAGATHLYYNNAGTWLAVA